MSRSRANRSSPSCVRRMRLRIAVCTLRIAVYQKRGTFCVTPLKMPLPRAPIDLARRGAWSAETTHAPRVPDVAVAAHRRAQPISKTFSRGVTSARACAHLPRPLSPVLRLSSPPPPPFFFTVRGSGGGVCRRRPAARNRRQGRVAVSTGR